MLLSSLLMVVQSSSVNMERLKDGNIELCRLFVVTNTFIFSFFLSKTKKKEIEKNIKKISA